MISRTPSVTFWRVISTRPSLEISAVNVFVRSSSSVLRSVFMTASRLRARAMSMKSITMIPPMSRRRSWLTTSSAASRLVLRDRVLEPRALAAADEAAGVDVDHGQRLGVVDDQVAAAGQVDAAREHALDRLVDAVGLEQRLARSATARRARPARARCGVKNDTSRWCCCSSSTIARSKCAEKMSRTTRTDRSASWKTRSGAVVSCDASVEHLVQLVQVLELALEVLALGAVRGGADDHAALARARGRRSGGAGARARGPPAGGRRRRPRRWARRPCSARRS